jgi:hypothetical protein
MRRALTAALLLLVLGALTIPILWYGYEMDPVIEGGAFSRSVASYAVFHFSLITTVLASAVWIFLTRSSKAQTDAKTFWKGSAYTLVVLLLYGFAVIHRRYTWTSARGVNDWAMFFGYTNAFFFSEAHPLSFAFEVAPAISLLSGALLYVHARIATGTAQPADTRT